MKTQNLNSKFYAGSILMLMPVIFFVSVVLEQFFQNNYLIENIFVPIDKTSGLLSAFIMVGLPFIALCINIIPFINFKVKKENGILKINFEIKPKLFNLLIASLGLLQL